MLLGSGAKSRFIGLMPVFFGARFSSRRPLRSGGISDQPWVRHKLGARRLLFVETLEHPDREWIMLASEKLLECGLEEWFLRGRGGEERHGGAEL